MNITEKYKIYIPEEMKIRLMNDAELFDYAKNDGSVNLNAFLKQLLVSYFDKYCDANQQLLDMILADLGNLSSISKNEANLIADKIIHTYMRNTTYRKDRSIAISLTVSGRSLDILRSIENNLLSQLSLSQYLHDLFDSYLQIPRNNREKIIFKDTFRELNEAIKKRCVITFSSSTVPKKVFSVKPYLIAASKEEQCNYLLCADNQSNIPRTFRISRIHTIYLSSEIFEHDARIAQELKEAAIKSPQSASRKIKASVRLTDRGIQMFRIITKNRPEVLQKEGNIYYFEWPQKQLEIYFSRFGEDAVIISPKECHENMMGFYKKALETYYR